MERSAKAIVNDVIQLRSQNGLHCVEDRPVDINRSNRSDDSIGMESLHATTILFQFLQQNVSFRVHSAPPGSGRKGMVVPSTGWPFFSTTFLTSSVFGGRPFLSC